MQMCDAAVCCGLIENALGRRLSCQSCVVLMPVKYNTGFVFMDDVSLWATNAAFVVRRGS
jgi:hypothetical protein